MLPNYGYTPQYYASPLQASQPQNYGQALQAQPQAANNAINWVQGEAGAKSFLVAPGQSVLLMDSEDSVFYIKSTDASGMPMPLRTFAYTEKTVQKAEPIKPGEYITREEFEKRIKEISDAKSTIPTA